MLGEKGAIVFLPRLISVNGAVGVIGLQLVAEDVLFDQTVIVLVRAAGSGLFLCLLDFAGAQKCDPLIIGIRSIGRELVDKLDFAHKYTCFLIS